MHRWPVLADFIGFELIEVAKAMADGSYWDVQDDGDARDCGYFGPSGESG
jgi:hypothetical protein